MQRINSIDGLFHEGNPATGQKGTKVTKEFLNSLQEEVAGVIEATGVELDEVKTDQLLKALKSGQLHDVLYASQYATLAEADAAAVASGRLLIISSVWEIPVGATLNADVLVIPGGKFNGPGALNINGRFNASRIHVFTGGISVVFAKGTIPQLIPEWWGAKADGLVESAALNTTAWNAAIASIPIYTHGTIVPSTGTYCVTTVSMLSKTANIIGPGAGSSVLKGIGTGGEDTLYIEGVGGVGAYYGTIRGISILGNQSGDVNLPSNATNGHGIHFKNAYVWNIEGCWIRGHGGHGVYFEGGQWTTNITCNWIEYNKLDGVHAVALSSDGQKNAINIQGNHIAGNKGNGVTKWGVAIRTVYNIIEGNKGYGVQLHPGVAANYSCRSLSTDYNYFELNSLGAYNLSAAANGPAFAVAQACSFDYNSVSHDVALGTTPVTFTLLNGAGYITNPPVRGFTMRGNAWSTFTPQILADFANMTFTNCILDLSNLDIDVTTRMINLGAATIITCGKKRVIQGSFFAAGTEITYPAVPAQFSNGVTISGVGKTVYFPSLLEVGQQFTGLDIHVYTDSTNYSVTLILRKRNAADNTSAYSTAKSVTHAAQSGSGVKSLVFGSGSDGGAFRVNETLNDYMFYITVSGTPGTYFYLGNPVISYN